MVKPAQALPAAPTRASASALVDALLYSVSHDLRSPLLTLSLSADLIVEALGDQMRAAPTGGAAVALNALQHGTQDLERMLQALAGLSRAARRPLEEHHAPLRMLLGGHIVLSDVDDLDQCEVAVDAMTVRELIDDICGDDPREVHVSVAEGYAILDLPRPEDADEVSGSPLMALTGSLQRYAGTSIERLAVGQVLLERFGGGVAVEEAVRLWLPEAAP
ncbi:MAG: hypothetical protein WD734_06370 [Dehalococcoidia bacterium]